jgi:hypothetical protein
VGVVVRTVSGASLSRRRMVPSGAAATFRQLEPEPLWEDFCQVRVDTFAPVG